MVTAMIDTMVFDALHDDEGARATVLEAIRHGELALVTTHVQEDQIAAIADAPRRKALQRLPRTVVPSSVPVGGVSRTGRAVVDPRSDYAEQRHQRHFQDALISDAAAHRADVLVTEDRRLAAEARRQGLEVWRTRHLVRRAARALRERP